MISLYFQITIFVTDSRLISNELLKIGLHIFENAKQNPSSLLDASVKKAKSCPVDALSSDKTFHFCL